MSDMVYTVGAEQVTAFFVPFRLPVLIFFSVIFPFVFFARIFLAMENGEELSDSGKMDGFCPVFANGDSWTACRIPVLREQKEILESRDAFGVLFHVYCHFFGNSGVSDCTKSELDV